MPAIAADDSAVDHRRLHAHLDECIDSAASKQELFTIIMVHLRGIRRINTVIGYDAGEEAVCTVIARIRASLPECDTVWRLSSDELVIVSIDCNSPSCAIKGSRSTIATLQEVVMVGGAECTVDPVLGIAVFPGDGQKSIDLVRHAALAAERAAAAEDPYYVFFSAGLGLSALKDFDLQQAIRRACSQRQFRLFYQPKVQADTLRGNGCEALIRWVDPTGAIRMPGEFLDVAERGGLMLPIGFFVLKSACEQLRDWLDRGFIHAAVSVNVTAKQFNTRDWTSTVAGVIERTGVPASRLTLELTESCAMSDCAAMIAKMHELRSLGVKISIDDFGTGHSSLAYLSRLPVDEIKIDRVFVQSASDNPTNARICGNVIELAHGIGAVVTAEGVEDMQQVEWLQELDCDLLQGFLFDRPQPAQQFERWLARDSDTTAEQCRMEKLAAGAGMPHRSSLILSAAGHVQAPSLTSPV